MIVCVADPLDDVFVNCPRAQPARAPASKCALMVHSLCAFAVQVRFEVPVVDTRRLEIGHVRRDPYEIWSRNKE